MGTIFKLCLCVSLLGVWTYSQKPLEGVKVLLFNKTGKMGPDGLPTTAEPTEAVEAMLRELAAREGFQLDTTLDSNMFTDEILEEYDITFWNNVMRNVLSPDQQNAFIRYMEQGGGYIGVHASAATRQAWPWYANEFISGDNEGGWQHHPDPVPVWTDEEEGMDHPIMQNIPPHLAFSGEWYIWDPVSPVDNPEISILQWFDSDPVWPEKNLGAQPASWAREYEEGRMFYTVIGHYDSLYSAGWYRDMMVNALNWTAKTQDPVTLWTNKNEKEKSAVSESGPISPEDQFIPYRLDGRQRKITPNSGFYLDLNVW